MFRRQVPAVLCGFAMCLGLAASAGAQEVTKKWESAYYEAGVTTQQLFRSARDGYGNAYLTGRVVANGAWEGRTVKFDSYGNQVWVAKHGKGSSPRIAVDQNGNVYATGYAEGVGPATIKYDPDGHQVWQAAFPRSGGNRAITAIATDSSGNVYVGGQFNGASGTQDYVVIKYDPNGTIVWEREYNGSGYGYDDLNEMTMDSGGNLIVTGRSKETAGWNYATIKYDQSGNQLWVALYTSGSGFNNPLKAISDDAGNVFVTGESTGNGTELDVATVKYDPNGNQVWVSRYNGPLNMDDRGFSITLDVNNDVIVGAGADLRLVNFDGHHAAIKYDGSTGNQLWVAAYPYPYPQSVAVATDGSGNVYLTARTPDISVVKYNSAGTLLWEQHALHQSGGSLTESFISVDAKGCVYVVDGPFVGVKYCQGVQVCN